MIKKVSDIDKDLLLEYVKKEASINLFIIGDVESFGLNTDYLDVYLLYQDDEITACVLRYYKNIIIYSDRSDFNISEIIDILSKFEYKRISGKKTVIDRIIPYLENIENIEECYFCELKSDSNLVKSNLNIKEATIEDIKRLYEVYKLEFDSSDYIQSNTVKLKKKAGRSYYYEIDGNIVSCASTAIESSVSAMIGGVTTLKEFRNLGYASKIVSKLSQDLLNESKLPCLFYVNPKAGSIYHRIGFKDIDMWSMITVK